MTDAEQNPNTIRDVHEEADPREPRVVDAFEVRTPTGTDDPLSDAEIQEYRQEIDRLDRIILDAVKRRTTVSQAIGKTRMGSGGTRLVHTREVAIINQFRDELGDEGPTLANVLLRLGRGRLG
ncbi:chorismate mutase [Corynebacterium guangdongense]|uniref:Chorismate mutase n=1 Tax=Corynebacterium guangdongense TaxID=1783348 RepID=A0ABU1ZV63_9CORY|nr:chorismate mutase [Corynebacterium guangdongense]